MSKTHADSKSHGLKGLLQIRDEISGMLEADGKAEQVLRGARLRTLARRTVLDQALDAAERGGAGEEPDAGDGPQSRLSPSLGLKGEHPSEGGHLPLRHLVPRMGFEPRV